MLTWTLLLTLAAVVAFALGGKKTEQAPAQTVTYGEFPGITDLQRGLVQQGQGWLNMPSSYPGMQQAQSLWAGSQPASWAGGARLQEMLAPGWLSTASPALGTITSGMRTQTLKDIEEGNRAIRMEFGDAGQSMSSPMVEALARSRQDALDRLTQNVAGLEYQDYSTRQGMLPQLIALAQANPLAAAQLLGQNGSQMVQMLLALATGGRGQMQIVPGQVTESGGWLNDLMGVAKTGMQVYGAMHGAPIA